MLCECAPSVSKFKVFSSLFLQMALNVAVCPANKSNSIFMRLTIIPCVLSFYWKGEKNRKKTILVIVFLVSVCLLHKVNSDQYNIWITLPLNCDSVRPLICCCGRLIKSKIHLHYKRFLLSLLFSGDVKRFLKTIIIFCLPDKMGTKKKRK